MSQSRKRTVSSSPHVEKRRKHNINTQDEAMALMKKRMDLTVAAVSGSGENMINNTYVEQMYQNYKEFIENENPRTIYGDPYNPEDVWRDAVNIMGYLLHDKDKRYLDFTTKKELPQNTRLIDAYYFYPIFKILTQSHPVMTYNRKDGEDKRMVIQNLNQLYHNKIGNKLGEQLYQQQHEKNFYKGFIEGRTEMAKEWWEEEGVRRSIVRKLDGSTESALSERLDMAPSLDEIGKEQIKNNKRAVGVLLGLGAVALFVSNFASGIKPKKRDDKKKQTKAKGKKTKAKGEKTKAKGEKTKAKRRKQKVGGTRRKH